MTLTKRKNDSKNLNFFGEEWILKIEKMRRTGNFLHQQFILGKTSPICVQNVFVMFHSPNRKKFAY